MTRHGTRLLSAIVAIVAVGLASSASATRVLRQIEGAYEASLTEVVLPASAAGYVIVPTCSTCAAVSLGTDAGTSYLVESAAVSFADFVAAAVELTRSGRAHRVAVYVFYDLETKRVTRLVLDDLEVG